MLDERPKDNTETDLSVIMPCYNEAEVIEKVLFDHLRVITELRRHEPFSFEILVVDDGSNDKTPEILARLKDEIPELRVLRNEPNRGIAFTLKRLYCETHGKTVYLTGSDDQWPAENLALVWKERRDKGYDVVVGVRTNKSEVYSPYRHAVSSAYNQLTRLACGVAIGDAGSIKLAPREFYQIPVDSTSLFESAERLVRAHHLGWSLGFVPIRFEPRTQGKARGAALKVVLPALRDLVCVTIKARLRKLGTKKRIGTGSSPVC